MNPEFSQAWTQWRQRVDLAEYDSRWDRLEADGESVHGEADFVFGLGWAQILDAGCGTGRVAAELSRRGRSAVGVDNDPDMLAYAMRRPEPVGWHQGNLASFAIDDRFDGAVMAGNILMFARPEDRAQVVINVARHLKPGGALAIGTSAAPDCGFDRINSWCEEAGLLLAEQHATWDRQPFDGGAYRVSVHRLATG